MEGRKGKGGESENSSSEHSIPHPGVDGGRGEEWDFPSPSTLFLTMEGGGRGVRISTPSTLFFTLGLKGEGGRSGNSNSEHSFLHLGVEGGGGSGKRRRLGKRLCS